jgi:hypothetical protein
MQDLPSPALNGADDLNGEFHEKNRPFDQQGGVARFVPLADALFSMGVARLRSAAARGFDGHNGTFLTAPALRRGRRANPKIDCAASNTLAAGRYDFY